MSFIHRAAWRQTVTAGTIVSFKFPSGEGALGVLKARPALVLHVANGVNDRIATIAYGTSRRTRANVGHELHVRKPADLEQAGLHKRTRFVGRRVVQVPLSDERFVVCATGTAVLGHLPDSMHLRLTQVVELVLGGQLCRE